MSDVFKQTAEFAETILGLHAPAKPTRLSIPRKTWAARAMKEELDEFIDATDMAMEVDAICDLIYFAAGRLHEMGVPGNTIFDAIHAANMRKERGRLEKRSHGLSEADGFDAVKPPGWKAADVQAIIDRTAGVLHAQKRIDRLIEKLEGMKLLVIGLGRHGKDTVCELLRTKYGMSFQSSSMFCAEHVLLPYFNSQPDLPTYGSAKECFDDRHGFTYRGHADIGWAKTPENGMDHRTIWYNKIRDYNRPDATRLAREMMEVNSIYCGMRSAAELHACKNTGVFDAIIWVDASDRLPPEDRSSMTLEPWMADYVLDNNGSLEDLEFNLDQLMEYLIETNGAIRRALGDGQ